MKKEGNIGDWFFEEFGKALSKLDPDVQELVQRLGKSGVEELVDKTKESIPYRGESISLEEAALKVEGIVRFIESSTNPEWLPGQVPIGDSPGTGADKI